MCWNKVVVAHQKCTVLVFHTKISSLHFLTDVFSLTPSTISSKNVLQEEFCPFSCFLWWTIPNCVHLDPCTLNFDQFYMTWNHLTMSKNSSAASIELWLVSNSSYWPERVKEKKNCTFLRFSQVKISKLCAETKFYWFSKVNRTCFFTLRFLLSFFRLVSLVSQHPEFLEKMLYKKNSALFLVFCCELFPTVFI